jgi:uncharacterized delta-60 repeat protein
MANFQGTGANETLTGGADSDSIDGAGGNDSITGGAGNDTIIAGAGTETVDGGQGSGDKLVVSGAYASYTITTPGNDTIRLVNASTGEDVTLTNTEYVQFSDGLHTLYDLRNAVFDANNIAPVFANSPAGTFIDAHSGGGWQVLPVSDGSYWFVGQSAQGSLQVWHINADGTPDGNVGAGGRVATPFTPGVGAAFEALLQPDGKLLVSMDLGAAPFATWALARFNTDGTLDTGFNGTGTMQMTVTANEQVRSIALQSDGKIIEAGFARPNGDRDFTMVRHNADGTIDTSFGTNGVVSTSLGAAEVISTVRVLSDGNILVAGTSTDFGANAFVVLGRYQSDGSVDTSFGTNGFTKVQVPDTVGLGLNGRSMYVQSDGKIVVLGEETTDRGDGGTQAVVMRFDATGHLDATFNGDGDSDGIIVVPTAIGGILPRYITEQSDGKIVFSGTGQSLGGSDVNGVLVRLNTDGSLDTSFGNGGIVTGPFKGNLGGEFLGVNIDASGNILVASSIGLDTGTDSNAMLLRYTSSGALDSSFNAQNPLGSKTIVPAGNTNGFDLFWGQARVYDAELASQDNYSGATLTVQRHGGANGADQFGFDDPITTSGNHVLLAGVDIGTFTNSGGTISVTFNSSATQLFASGTMNLVTWHNDTVAGGSSVQFDWTFNDGSGAGNASVTGTSTVEVVTPIDGTLGNDTLTGTASDDAIGGNSGNDSLDGAAGDDLIYADAGNDTIIGGTGNDTLVGGLGADTFRPGAGNDSVDGGDITDRINYTDGNTLTYKLDATASVYIDLTAIHDFTANGKVFQIGEGVVRDGQGGTDKVTNVNFIVGSTHNDTILGSSAHIFEMFEGGAGNDYIDGGALIDTLNQTDGNRASFQNASSAETIDLAAGTASGGDGNDTLVNINQVRGSAFADSIMGSNRTDYTEQFEGRAGNDTIDGRGGFDIVRYDAATTGVSVNLATGTASDGQGGTDTLQNIEGVFGSNFNDSLVGGNAANGTVLGDGLSEVFRGGAGNDTIDGGQGYDRADYTTSTSGANVTLGGTGNGTAQDGLGGTDTLINIEAVRGSAFDDTLTGSDSAAFESFEGREGNDIIDGKGGTDRVDYTSSPSGTYINLDDGSATDGWGGADALFNIEWARGSRDFNDTMVGNSGANRLEGQGGNDDMDGGMGSDTLTGGDGNDTVAGGGDNDWVSGNAGNDVLAGGDAIDWVDYSAAGSAVQVDLGAGTATGDGNDTLSGFEAVRGSSYGDNLKGGGANEQFVGGAGNDTIDGGGGDHNGVAYWDVSGTGGVSVNLAASTAADGQGGTDTLANIQDATGSKNDDTIVGSNADNNLNGGLGNDSIDGGLGNDWTGYYDATAGVNLNLGTGVVTGGGGNDTLASIENASGSGYNDTITGTSGDNALRGEAGNDTIDGGAGNDYITGGSGNDSLAGNTGTDTVDYYYSDANAGVNVNLATGAATGGGGNDTLSGFENVSATDFNDTLTGDLNGNFIQAQGGNDSVSAGAGNDTIDAGTGVDTVDGGADADTLVLHDYQANYVVTSNGADTRLVNAGTGEDITVRNVEQIQFIDATQSIADVIGGGVGGNLSLTGTSGNDTLSGGSGNDTLSGFAGNDTLIGNDGNDLFFGGAGADSIVGGNGIDTVNYNEAGTIAGVIVNLLTGIVSGGSGADTLVGIENVQGSNLADSITGSAADNGLAGAGGNDTLLGGDGNDWLAGGAGNDSIVGGNGIDTSDYSDATAAISVTLNAGAGTVTGGGGTDTLSGIENINGSNFNDTIVGDANANLIAGGAGNDSLVGGAGFDTLNYNAAAAAVNVNLATGVASGGAGTDTIAGFEAVNGSGFNDTLTGDGGDNMFAPGGGNDLVNGAAGTDTVAYWDATAGVGIDLGSGAVTGGSGNDTLAGIENATGSAFNDTITGSSGANFIDGGLGDDVLDGGAGFDTAGYGSATAGVAANLGTGVVTGGGGNDTIAGFEGVSGSAFDDTLAGGGANENFNGGQGNDAIDGGAGSDLAGYWDATAGVTANLVTGLATGGAGNDTLANIENLSGSTFNDSLTGNGGANVILGDAGNDTIDGGGGNDFLRGGAGADLITGGSGIDTADFGDATAGVTVTLASGAVTGGAGADTLSGIENIGGSAFNDSITGDAGANFISGGAGNDTLLGGAGSDGFDGGAGNDSIDGGAITDRVNYTDLNSVTYANSAAGINLNLATGIVLDGLGGTDTLANIDFVTGSGFNDTLVGSATANLFEQFDGGAGNDTIDGGAIDPVTQANSNRVSYQNAGSAVSVDLGAGTAAGASTGNDTLININHVRGSNYADTLTGSDTTVFTEQFEGRAGNDTIDGKGGFDLVRYDSATSAVNVNLSTDIASDGLGGTDTLLNIEGVRGSNFDDTITGGNAANGSGALDGFEFFIGNGGNDTIDGGAGYDRVDYSTSTAGANVTLGGTGNGTAQDGLGGTDTLINIEAVRGSAFNDTLTGSDSAAFESFEGREGNDIIDGKGGIDRADYKNVPAGVNVNLAGNTAANDGYGTVDTLLNIENVRGSAFNDVIAGNAGANLLEGLAGNDSIAAGDGDDTIDAGTGADSVDGGNGTDTLKLQGAQADYVVGRTATDTILTDGATGENITVRGVENFQFTDGTKTLADVQGNSLSDFADNYVGTAGDDLIDGKGGDDTLSGMAGNDTIIGGTGNDLMIGGTGNDVYTADNANDSIFENDGEGTDRVNISFAAVGAFNMNTNAPGVENATVTGTLAVNVTGNGLDNLIAGNSAANALTGGAGNDTLDGGAGNDTLAGGAGDDTYVIDLATDVVNETVSGSGGTDTVKLMFASAGTYTLGAGVENAFIGNGTLVTINGNDLNNVITGNAGANSLVGGLGDDTLAGGTATGLGDTLDGGAGTNDTVNMLAAFSADYVVTRVSSTDTKIVNPVTGEIVTLRNVEAVHFADNTVKTMSDLWGNNASALNDSLIGTSGDDTMNGLAGNDTLLGLEGNDTLIGGIGIDSLVGGLGDDVYVVDVATDVILEAVDQGTDTVNVAFAAAGIFNMATNAANVENGTVTSGGTIVVSIVGNALNNFLTGNGSANALTGGEGNDTLDGGLGVDTLTGGAGDDTYFINATTDIVNETVTGSGGNDTVNLVFAGAATWSMSLNVENAVVANGTGGVNITGNGLANQITGNSGSNVLVGGDGNDTIAGSGGTDTVDGGLGNGDVLVLAGTQGDYVITRPTATTTVFAKSGVQVTASNIEFVKFDDGTYDYNTVVAQIGSVGNDVMNGTGGDDTLDGGLGNDLVSGLAGGDSLLGGSGNDTIVGGTGADWLDGGDGNDVYVYNEGDGDDFILQNDTVGADVDVLRLTQAGLTADRVAFTRGFLTYDDLVVNITQGSGETATVDQIVVVNFFLNDAVNPGTIDQVVITATGTTFTQADIAAQALVTGDGDHIFVGYNTADLLTGTANGDWMSAGTGNDTVNAGIGNDLVFGGAGNDVLNGGGDNDTVIGGAGADTLAGGAGDDTLSGGAGSDVYQFDASSGNDLITESLPTLTADQLVSGLGPVYIVGDGDAPLASDTDVLNINGVSATSALATRAGDDLVISLQAGNHVTVQNYFANGVSTIEKVVFTSSNTVWSSTTIRAKVLVPTDGDDSLIGYLGGDKMSGGLGNDTLDGREGKDTLTGGAGDDTLTGGSGEDRFVFDQAPGSGVDTITDFTSGVDTIMLKGSMFAGLGAIGSRVGLSDKLTYDAGTGALAYDADGAGGAAGVVVAILGISTHPAAFGADFVIF